MIQAAASLIAMSLSVMAFREHLRHPARTKRAAAYFFAGMACAAASAGMLARLMS